MQNRHLVSCALAITALCAPLIVQAQSFPDCRGLLFSTEEDFVSPVGERTDGNSVISDGDLLAWHPDTGSVSICARNAQLLPPSVLVEVGQSLGLDAVDAIQPEDGFIAFSTELDEQFGLFGHGDILFPNGAIIPNEVLVARFQLPANMGLDAVQFIGETEAIISGVKLAQEIGRDALERDPQTYLDRLKSLEVDIWFSLEGTSDPTGNPNILDGDLLSAVTGSIVAPNEALLDPPIPAGILDRGVDFGLDAVSTDRKGDRESIRFSTEILYGGEEPFTDGDVLQLGGTVVVPNERLIADFQTKEFLGLDALGFALPEIDFGNPHIDTLCGRSYAAADFGPDGLWRVNAALLPPGEPPRRPCGQAVPIDGTLPADLITSIGTMTEFRVVWQSIDTIGAGDEIETNWRLYKPATFWPFPCILEPTPSLSTDGTDGWMNAADFLSAMTGDPTGPSGDGTRGCANPHLHLAVWQTNGLPAAQQNDLTQVRLEWRVSSGTTAADAFSYRVQLDNELPVIPAYPGGFEVRLSDGMTKVPACGEAPTGESVFQVWADFDDPYYWHFTLKVEGGDPPTSHDFDSPSGPAQHNYYTSPDGLPGIDNTDTTGTAPNGTMVHLRDIDMTELGANFKRCCYLLELVVRDASIRHNFSGFAPSPANPATRRITTFEAGN